MLHHKKIALGFLICLAIVFSMASFQSVFARENISVTVNGVPLTWENAAPSMEQGRLTIPLSSFCAALGAEIKWEPDKQEAFVFWRERYAWMQVTNPTLYYGPYIQKNSRQLSDVYPMTLPVEPELKQGRLVVPLAPLTEAFGGSVNWNPDTQTADATIPLPSQGEENLPADFLPEEELPPEPEPGYFQLINLDEAAARYENDDPFVLVQYDGGLPSESLYEMMKAAADMETKIYGLDVTKETAARELEFGADGGHEVNVYFINGYDQVAVLGDPGYRRAVDALDEYISNLT